LTVLCDFPTTATNSKINQHFSFPSFTSHSSITHSHPSSTGFQHYSFSVWIQRWKASACIFTAVSPHYNCALSTIHVLAAFADSSYSVCVNKWYITRILYSPMPDCFTFLCPLCEFSSQVSSSMFLIGWKSQLSLTNKLLIHKIILKPIWAYWIQLWGSASNSHLEILERFQSKVLRILTDAQWYVPNALIRRDLQVPTVRQEVRNYSVTYRQRLTDHPNNLANSLFQGLNCNRRLNRHYPVDLVTRF
jgi:hypothetical protein